MGGRTDDLTDSGAYVGASRPHAPRQKLLIYHNRFIGSVSLFEEVHRPFV